jgi:phosphoesterase RecJ-like protein
MEIDHHEFRKPFGHIDVVDYNAAAVGEVVYIILKGMGVKITKNIAQNILTSIIVETNSFRLPGIRPLTFDICSELMKDGVDFYKLVDTVFWSRTKEASLLLGTALAGCRFAAGGRLVWSMVRKKDYRAAGGSDEDVDPVVDEMRSVKDVKVALLFREREDGRLRVSMRSKGKINVAALAEEYSGGGHFDSAGCYLDNDAGVMKNFLRAAERLLR